MAEIKFQFPTDELEERITNRLEKKFDELKKEFQPRTPTEYLTRNETAELLKVDLSTLHNWVKKQKIRAYGISHRVYFKRSEIEQVLTPIN